MARAVPRNPDAQIGPEPAHIMVCMKKWKKPKSSCMCLSLGKPQWCVLVVSYMPSSSSLTPSTYVSYHIPLYFIWHIYYWICFYEQSIIMTMKIWFHLFLLKSLCSDTRSQLAMSHFVVYWQLLTMGLIASYMSLSPLTVSTLTCSYLSPLCVIYKFYNHANHIS